MNGVCGDPTSRIMLHNERPKAYLLKSRKRKVYLLLPLPLNMAVEALARVISKKKKNEIKVIQIGNKEVKLSLFADNMILYVENSPQIYEETELINELNKAA